MSHSHSQIAPVGSSPQDVVVLVMGVTGVGKSTFISRLTGDDAGVGHDLSSYTQGVDIYCRVVNDRRVYLIDTPGFNDTWRSDVDVLKEIAFILAQIRRHGLRLAGTLYLHRITDNRVSGSALKNFRLLEKLCGSEGAARLLLVTTMWNGPGARGLDYHEAATREMLLGTTYEYWGRLRQHGSQLKRWNGSSWSALAMIKDLLHLNTKEGFVTLQIQKELVVENKQLNETAAGQELLSGFCSRELEYTGKLQSHTWGEVGGNASLDELSELREELRGVREAQQALRINTHSLLLLREQSYKRVLGLMQSEINEISRDLDRERAHRKFLEQQREATEERMDAERRNFRSQESSLDADDRAARRRRQSLDRARQRLHRVQVETAERFHHQRMQSEQESAESKATTERLKKREVLRKNLIPLLGVLGGTTLAVAGATTGIIPLAGAGVGLGFAYAAKIQLSRMPENHPRVSLVRGPASASGQGASGAALQ